MLLAHLKFLALPDDFFLGLDFLYRRRHRDPHGLKDLAAHTLALRADRKTVTVFHHFDTLQRFEILFDVAPFKIIARCFKTVLKVFA